MGPVFPQNKGEIYAAPSHAPVTKLYNQLDIFI